MRHKRLRSLIWEDPLEEITPSPNSKLKSYFVAQMFPGNKVSDHHLQQRRDRGCDRATTPVRTSSHIGPKTEHYGDSCSFSRNVPWLFNLQSTRVQGCVSLLFLFNLRKCSKLSVFTGPSSYPHKRWDILFSIFHFCKQCSYECFY